MAVSVAIAIFGIGLAWVLYVKNPALPGQIAAKFQGLYRAIFNKWFVDELYDALFVNPTKRLGTFLWKGFDVVVVDGIVNGVGRVIELWSKGLRHLQTGLVHNYALSMVVGVVLIVGFYVFR